MVYILIVIDDITSYTMHQVYFKGSQIILVVWSLSLSPATPDLILT